jgi:SDR family mycofactocin-dependent oxidoreductase
MGRLDGKVAFITGAARGQGRSHAVRLGMEGADVIMCDIAGPVGVSMIPAADPDDLRRTVDEVEATGCRVVWAQADVRDPGALRELAARGARELGHIDVVVANAGILTWAKTHELTQAQWQDVIDVNLTGVFNAISATLPHLLHQGTGGSVIAISSTAGLKGQPFVLPYAAAKHGIVGIVNSLAIEYGDYNIRANSIHPCGVRTTMGSTPTLLSLIDERAETVGPVFMNSLPIDVIEPEDVSNAVVFLASDESKYITGMQLKVDAGAVGR